jgi:hypothetical protein
MLLGEGIFGLAVLALWVYAIFDVITTDESVVQNLPKMIWLLIVILLPPIGPLAWLLLGRPRGAAFRVGSGGQPRSAPEPHSPPPGLPERRMSDEDYQRRREEALAKHQAEREVELRRREEELRKREEELRRREQGLE